ncbi:MAG: hypothetical protein HZC55_07130 [Verrucomicrobia bacterium]|nr:hypothetical protein [Verrucomicrobiota bacterium]
MPSSYWAASKARVASRSGSTSSRDRWYLPPGEKAALTSAAIIAAVPCGV